MIQQFLIGFGGVTGGLFGIHHLGRMWTRWEMNRLINNPQIPEDLRYQAEVLLDTYNLNKKMDGIEIQNIEEDINTDLIQK